jgi:hypothetical protein
MWFLLYRPFPRGYSVACHDHLRKGQRFQRDIKALIFQSNR